MKWYSLSLTTAFLMVLCAFGAVAEAPEIKSLDEAFQALPQYELGQNPAALEYIRTEVLKVQQDPQGSKALADRLAAFLQTDASRVCKRFVMRQLQIIATADQVSAVAPLLTDEAYSHYARYILQAVPGDAVDQALLKALQDTNGVVQVGLIDTLAARGNQAHAAVLSSFLESADENIFRAAAVGLGNLGGDDAAEALSAARVKADGKRRECLTDAYLDCAQSFWDAGDKAEAQAIYEALYGEQESLPIRIAALRGLVQVTPEMALSLVLDALTSGDPVWQQTALSHVPSLSGEKATRAFTKALRRLDDDMQAALLHVLAVRGDQGVLPAVKKALRSDEKAVQKAAIEALGQIGNASAVRDLYKVLDTEKGRMQRAARDALEMMPGEDVNEALLPYIEKAEGETQALLLGIAATRVMYNAIPLFFSLVQSEDEDVRHESYRGLGTLVRLEEMPQLLALLSTVDGDEARSECEGSIVVAARRLNQEHQQAQTLIQRFKDSESVTVKTSLLKILASLADETTLDTLIAAASDDNAALRRVVLEGFSQWPTTAPMDALHGFAKSATTAEDRQLALGGYIRHLREPSERTAEESVKRFAAALELADTLDLKRLIIAGLGDTEALSALDILESYLDTEGLQEEAAVAAEKIRQQLYVATASEQSDLAHRTLDGSDVTRWYTGVVQAPGQWFQLDMGRSARVGGVHLNNVQSPKDYPRAYEVYVFDDEANMGTPVAAGEGEAKTHVVIQWEKPKTGRYIRIVQTGSDPEYWWSIHLIRVLPR